MEPGETLEDALHREVLEETGCHMRIEQEVGMIEERRNALGLCQLSFCYYAIVVGQCTKPSFTDQEIQDGFSLDWVSPQEALLLIRSGVPQSYHGKFVQARDEAFLASATEMHQLR